MFIVYLNFVHRILRHLFNVYNKMFILSIFFVQYVLQKTSLYFKFCSTYFIKMLNAIFKDFSAVHCTLRFALHLYRSTSLVRLASLARIFPAVRATMIFLHPSLRTMCKLFVKSSYIPLSTVKITKFNSRW